MLSHRRDPSLPLRMTYGGTSWESTTHASVT
jgi:hypothetical protein